MKKLLICLMAILMLFLCFSVFVSAEEEDMTTVFVTISDASGSFVLAGEPIVVHDTDGDGMLTVHDALSLAHDAFCKGGYAVAAPYGDPEITKLWGISDRDFGCYIEGGLVYRLSDSVFDGDHIQAFVCSENGTDLLSYFSKSEVTFDTGKEDLTLYGYALTVEGNLRSYPISGAEITVNGEKIGKKTDKEGKFTLSANDLAEGQKNVISAEINDGNLVPPILVVSAETLDAAGMDLGSPMLWLILTVVLVTAGVFAAGTVMKKRKK